MRKLLHNSLETSTFKIGLKISTNFMESEAHFKGIVPSLVYKQTEQHLVHDNLPPLPLNVSFFPFVLHRTDST